MEVSKKCLAYEAIKNVIVEGSTRLKTFSKLEESISVFSKVLVIEKATKTRKLKID